MQSLQRHGKILIDLKDAYNMQILQDWNTFRWSRITLLSAPATKLIRMKTRLVWAPPVFNTCDCDLCGVLVRLGHPRPSVVTAPAYCGCPARTYVCDPVSRVRPDQSATPCCARWCVVVHRARRRGKSRPHVCWVPSHTPPRHGYGCGPVDPRGSLIALAVTTGLHSTCQLDLLLASRQRRTPLHELIV